MSDKTPKNVRLNLRLTEIELQALKKAAKGFKMTVSELVRVSVQAFINGDSNRKKNR